MPTPSPLEQQQVTARKQAEEVAAKQAQEEALRQQALLEQQALAKRLADEEARRKEAEESARREAQALALQQQMQATQKLEEEMRARQAAEEREKENAKRLAMAEEQRRQAALLKQQEEERIHAQEQEALRLEEQRRQEEAQAQAEQAERERAAAEARRKEEEEAARRRAEAEAVRQRELERRLAENNSPAAAASATPVARITQNIGGFAARALNQARNEDLLSAGPTAHPLGRQTDSLRRRSIFGSIDNEVDLRAYVDAWSQKIERNGSLNYPQPPKDSKDLARGDPVVIVSIRSDGSIEDIVIEQTGGRPELDEAVRRILHLYAPFAKFPPGMAHRYDVISIRRIWRFGDRLRIVEEVK